MCSLSRLTVWIGAFLGTVVACQPSWAAADLSRLSKPGSYVIVSDKDGRVVSGAYWLSPDLKLVIHSEKNASPTAVTYVDREMFPRVIVHDQTFLDLKVAYDPDPTAMAAETVSPIKLTERNHGAFGNAGEELRYLAVLIVNTTSLRIDGIDISARTYKVDGEPIGIPGRHEGRRTYLETLDVDLSEEDAARAARIETGEALSTGDFNALYISRALPLLPDVAKCYADLRQTAAFQALAKKQHDTADRWMATVLMAGGIGWWARKDAKPADFEPAMYSYCQK